jgi:hypothetical protein
VQNKKPIEEKITLDLTEKEANIIIEALGHLPFMKVYKLIEKIHLQAKKSKS